MKHLTAIFKLLSDDTRLRILLLLQKDQLCVCQLSGILNVPQPRISKNLAKMRDLDIVTDERQDKFIYYALKNDQEFLHKILSSVTHHPMSEPIFEADLNRLKHKEDYLTQCGVHS